LISFIESVLSPLASRGSITFLYFVQPLVQKLYR